jgi:hypothetical protein
LSFEELGEHPFLELEYSVPGPNTLARLNIALDAATAAGKFTHWLHDASCWTFLAVLASFIYVTLRIARLNIALDAATAAGKFTHWLRYIMLLAGHF